MTKYVYAGEMQNLCFMISQRFKVLEEEGMQDFYNAASEGFAIMQKGYSISEASIVISKAQETQLENTAAYAKEIQKQAAEKLDKEIAI